MPREQPAMVKQTRRLENNSVEQLSARKLTCAVTWPAYSCAKLSFCGRECASTVLHLEGWRICQAGQSGA